MPRAKSLLKGSLLLLCLGLLGFAGKKAGQQLARSGMIDRSRADAAPQEVRKPQDAARAGLAASTYKRLTAMAASSSNLNLDWEAGAELDDLIAKLNAAELAELFGMLEVPSQDGFMVLARKIGSAWMAKDPDAALRGLLAKQPNSNGWLATSAFAFWAQDHPDAALAWLDAAELPEKPANLRDSLRANAMMGLVERDFERTTAEYLKMKEPGNWDGASNGLMGAWGSMYADDPLMRGRLLEFAKTTGNPKDHASLNHQLLKEWPQEDAMGMMNYLHELRGYLESDAVPAKARLESDGTAVAAAIYREYDRPALEWWMERHADSREAPAPLREAMAQWVQRYPDKVNQWFEEQPPSVQRDALASSLIPVLSQTRKFTEAAGMIGTMQDPALRQAASERLVMLWSEQDANAAAAWQKSLGGVGE